MSYAPEQAVEVKRVGLGRHWEPATVIEETGNRVRVKTVHGGSELLMPLARVRPAKAKAAFVPRAVEPTFDRYRAPSRPATLVAVPKPRPPLRDRDHLQRVREMPCCWRGCGAPAPSDPHHFGPHKRGMGQKCDDYRTVPLCGTHHDAFHDGTLGEKKDIARHFYCVQVDILVDVLAEMMEEP